MQPAIAPNPAPQQPPVPLPTMPATISSTAGTNKTWSRAILLNNYITLAICVGFLLLVDVPILIQSPELEFFFGLMVTSTILVICFTITDHILSRSLRYKPTTGMDGTILAMGILRNIIAVLNVIPYIQIIAILLTIGLIAPAIVITEVILTIIRAQKSRQVLPQQPNVQ